MRKAGLFFSLFLLTVFIGFHLVTPSVVNAGEFEGKKNSRNDSGTPPIIETVWRRTFDGRVTGIGSDNGSVLVINHNFSNFSLDNEVLVYDDSGKVIWSRMARHVSEIASTPTWNRISFRNGVEGKELKEWRKHQKWEEEQPPVIFQVYNRNGQLLVEKKTDYGYAWLTNDSFLVKFTSSGGWTGIQEIHDLDGNQVKRFRSSETHRKTMANGEGIVFYGGSGFTIVDTKGEVILSRSFGRLVLHASMDREYLLVPEHGLFHLYHIPTGKELLSFEDTKNIGELSISPSGKRAAIITRAQNLFIYDLNPVNLIGNYNISDSGINVFGHAENGTEATRSIDRNRISFDGERVYLLGKNFSEDGRKGLNTPVDLGCWDLKGNLVWKVRLSEAGRQARFADGDASAVTVWGQHTVERMKIKWPEE